MAATETTAGTVITFYSYKGGLGRTMAVANIGRLLARRNTGRKVLLIDWDLEAPTLHQHFPVFTRAPRGGLINYFLRLRRMLSKDDRLRASLQNPSDAPEALEKALPLSPYTASTGVEGLAS